MHVRLIQVLFVAFFVSLLSPMNSFAVQSQAETIQISQSKESYVLTVPVSQLVMTIPKGGLTQKTNAQGGSAASPRYFFFGDDALNLFISGWFESEGGFQGVEKFWKNETKAWKRKGLPEPRDVSFVKIDNWDAIIYDIELPKSSNSHVRAHWVQAGTWIDIHISITSDHPSVELRAKLADFLKTIQVKTKN